MEDTENKFKEGDHVFSLVLPEEKLIIRRYIDRIYYCQVQGDSKQPERVYFEREIALDKG